MSVWYRGSVGWRGALPEGTARCSCSQPQRVRWVEAVFRAEAAGLVLGSAGREVGSPEVCWDWEEARADLWEGCGNHFIWLLAKHLPEDFSQESGPSPWRTESLWDVLGGGFSKAGPATTRVQSVSAAGFPRKKSLTFSCFLFFAVLGG